MTDTTVKEQQLGNCVQPLRDRSGMLNCFYMPAMDSRCMQCHEEIKSEDGLFYVFGDPYFGCLHRRCTMLFNFNGMWPHHYPRCFYASEK